MARPSIFKRKFLIEKQFQGRFILLYAIAVSTIVGLGTGFLYWRIDLAVEQHLYRTHIKIERVGDFLVDLLFHINFYIILLIVAVILSLSLFIFKKINNNFAQMEETIKSMAGGDFTKPFNCDNGFMEIGGLTTVLEQTRSGSLANLEHLHEALDSIEQEILHPTGENRLPSEKLEKVLRNITLS